MRSARRLLAAATLAIAMSASLPAAAPGAPQAPQPIAAPPVAENQAPLPAPPGEISRDYAVPAVQKVGPGRYRLGEIVIDKAARSISFPAEVNMKQGLLEYLLVKNGGKTHESLLRTRVQPYHLQLACLLLGLEGGRKALSAQGVAETPDGETVELSLELADGKRVQTEQWLTLQVAGERREVPKLRWIFTGSLVREGVFAAQGDGSIAALYHDPVAMIDNASPEGASDEIWYAMESAVPPVGTPVTVLIHLSP